MQWTEGVSRIPKMPLTSFFRKSAGPGFDVLVLICLTDILPPYLSGMLFKKILTWWTPRTVAELQVQNWPWTRHMDISCERRRLWQSCGQLELRSAIVGQAQTAIHQLREVSGGEQPRYHEQIWVSNQVILNVTTNISYIYFLFGTKLYNTYDLRIAVRKPLCRFYKQWFSITNCFFASTSSESIPITYILFVACIDILFTSSILVIRWRQMC